MILLLVLFALFIAIGSLIGVLAAAISLSIGIVLSFWSFWSAASASLQETNAVVLNDARLLEETAALAVRAGIPAPLLYKIKDSQPNAFSIGANPRSAVVILTNTLCQELTGNELRAVIAHELAHIRNKDMLACTVASSLVDAVLFLAFLLGAVGLSTRRHGGVAIIALAILAPLIALIVKLAISRSMEYRADRDAAVLCGDPRHLITALRRLESLTLQYQSDAAICRPAFAPLFIVDPLPKTLLGALLSPHPPISSRIARLENMLRAATANVHCSGTEGGHTTRDSVPRRGVG